MTTSGTIGITLAVSLGGIGAVIGEAMIIAAAFNAMLRNPEMKSRLLVYMILFVALVETCAIYGLVIAFRMLGLDASAAANLPLIETGLAVGLPGIIVALGEGYVAKIALNNMGKNPELSSSYMVFTILGIALIETCAIYGLIIAFRLLG